MAALTLIIVGKYFLPIFIEKGLYTIPEFVEQRYSTNLKTILAVFWISLYVFVNLASVLYLGALALETIMGIPMMYGVMGLGSLCCGLFLIRRAFGGVVDGCHSGGFLGDGGLGDYLPLPWMRFLAERACGRASARFMTRPRTSLP